MKRILIVDDEAHARERLARLLQATGKDFSIDFATNGFTALEKIKLLPPDILFLDIQMPGMTGFEVLQNIEKREFQVIFQTAYDQFAIRAFEESVCDYLLKPFESERLEKALQKAMSGLDDKSQLDRLEASLKSSRTYLQKLTIQQGNKAFNLDISDIICFKSQNHYTCVYTQIKDYVTELSLTHLEERLDPKLFFRCHRSHIVAIQQIKNLVKGAQMTVYLNNGMELEVSRQHRTQMRERILEN